MLTKKRINCDLCVIGGGLAGLCAAISAAREGLNVVLMHERPVLGGNASSEIRMWVCGAYGENNRETGILEEIQLENFYRNPTKSYPLWDSVLYDFVHREEKITLLLNCTCMDASVSEGTYADGRDRKINSVTGYQMTTQCFIEVFSKFYCDSSGDSILAPLCNAEFRMGREASSEFNEDTDKKIPDDMTMGMSCLIYGRETNKKIKYIPPKWSTKLSEKNFENRNPNIHEDSENFWYLELGGDRDSIADTEELRDDLVALAMGTWDYIKNSGKFNADNWDVDFLGFLPGKRESRRMCGEYMISQRDISDGKVFEDEVAFGGWTLDDHFPGGFYHRGVPNTNILTPAPYSIPYRALYSKNVENLFFAGRNISMTHMAMSSIRVMSTCALLGEAVGKASAIAVKESVTPHVVYCHHIDLLQELLLKEDCYLPSKTREISTLCKNAVFNSSDYLRNGQDRAHKIYNTTESDYVKIKNEAELCYTFDKANIKSAHIVFDSDLNRNTLTGSLCERTHGTRANIKLDSPDIYMPKTLCKEFKLIGGLNGNEEVLLHVRENTKRSFDLAINKELDSLKLIPLSNWGNNDKTTVISFDFSG